MTELNSTSITYGYCNCGCGEPAPIAKKTQTRDGAIKGQPLKYIHGHNSYRTDPLHIEEDRGYETPCHIWQRAFNTQGHAQITVLNKCHIAHKYFYENRYGPVAKRIHLHHLCQQRDCVNLEHLEPLTSTQHARIRKNVKLTWEAAEEMRKLYAAGGYSYRTLGEQFRVSPQATYDVIKRRRWVRPS